MQRIARAWTAYWLAPGGRYATAVVRIALAISMMWTLARYGTTFELESARYYPHGIWLLFPGRPGPGLIDVITVIAWVSSVSMLLGFHARISHLICMVSTVALVTLGVSETPAWTHRDVPTMLAMIAFLGAPGGDAWSIDAWRRARRGEPLPHTRQTGLRLVLLTVVSVFVVAGYWKLRTGGLQLGWVLSDNMRHQLLVRYDWLQLPRPAAAEWIIQDVWRYRLIAGANVVSQLVPATAPFLGRHPKLRALLAVVFVLEVLGLGYVMDLWNLQWIPLAVVFIDWDGLYGWLRPGMSSPRADAPPPASARWHLWYAGVFLAFYGVQAFVLNQRLNIYPFSSFPLFAEVRSKQPYLEHQSYQMLGGHIEVIADRPLTAEEERWIAMQGKYRWMWRARTPQAVRSHLDRVLTELTQFWPDLKITGVRMSLSVFEAPAYPAAPRFDRHDFAILGELDADGSFRTAVGSLGPDRQIAHVPPSLDIVGTSVVRDLSLPAAPVASRVTSLGILLSEPLVGDSVYLVVTSKDGKAWLAGYDSTRDF